ncbi:MAG: DNA-3-methyladenine glycosylase [Planctomycetaceae bacterium]|jgi:DNA-3-methyladenine glycosylase|nr:DNA-3-methyladenine glycosylase [Phycisphaerales bacterium]MCE2653164.1 DNA-3-methyladenine glycosylase [Planctomycetaceae bacterium]
MPTPEPVRTDFRPLTQADFAVPAHLLARRLIGCLLLVRDGPDVAGGIIVETEAYLGIHDRASHAFAGRRTARNQSMYGPPGLAYVYFTYGMHHCLNVVCADVNVPAAVLIRAIQPTVGLHLMQTRRQGPLPERRLCAGPGRLCQALGISLVDDGRRFGGSRSRLSVGMPDVKMDNSRAIRTTRIGVDYAGSWASRPLRWVLAGSPWLSRSPHS